MATNIKTAMRAVKNSVMNYDDSEVRVREATSNDPWGCSSSLMMQIAEDTHHRYRYKSTMDMISKRLTDYQHLNHVLKALMLIEFLLKHGDERFVQDMQDRKVIIRRLRGYKYYKDNKEIGGNVRKWANKVLALLENKDELKRERETARTTRGKIQGFSNDSTPREQGGHSSGHSSHTPKEPREEYKPEYKPEFQIEFQPDPTQKAGKDDDEEEEEAKPKKKKKGTKKAKKADAEEAPSSTKKSKNKADEEEEEDGGDDVFDPDAFDDGASKKKKNATKPSSTKAEAPASSGKGGKKKPKEPEPEEDEEEENADGGGGDFQFDANAENDDFAFAFEDDPKNAKAAPQKGGKKGAAANPDDFLFGIAAASTTKSSSSAIPDVADDSDALFDFGGSSTAKPESPVQSNETDLVWDQLTNVNLKDDGKPQKKQPTKKAGKTLNEMGGGTEIVPFDFGAAVNGGAPPAAANPFAPQPAYPWGAPAAGPVNPYGFGAAPAPSNPYGGGYGQPMAPMAMDPFGAPFGAPQSNPYGANPFGAPAANPYGAPAANPFGAPAAANPFATPAPQPKPAAAKDPFSEFNW